jgi:hypothetical protein
MRCKALFHKASNQKGVNLGAIFPAFSQKDFNSTGKSKGEINQKDTPTGCSIYSNFRVNQRKGEI